MKVFSGEDILYPFVFLLKGDYRDEGPMNAAAFLKLRPHIDSEGYKTTTCDVIKSTGIDGNSLEWVNIALVVDEEQLEPYDEDISWN